MVDSIGNICYQMIHNCCQLLRLPKAYIYIIYVQRRATKLIPQIKELTYENRLRTLNLPTLKYRRYRGDMIETYKILHKKYDREVCPSLTRADIIRRGHDLKLYKERAKTKTRQYSFTMRIVDAWNSLPTHVVQAPSAHAFERRLDKVWKDQEVLFNFDSDLKTSSCRHNNISESETDLDI